MQDVHDAFNCEQRLFVYGFVRCADTLGQVHTWGFGYECLDGELFQSVPGEIYPVPFSRWHLDDDESQTLH